MEIIMTFSIYKFFCFMIYPAIKIVDFFETKNEITDKMYNIFNCNLLR